MTDSQKRRGRPPLDPSGRPAAPVHVKLSASLYDSAAKAAATRRESIQDLIRRGLRRELGDEAK
jgi:hypothetical protein